MTSQATEGTTETLDAAVQSLANAFRAAGLETPALDARRLVLESLSLDSAALLREPERALRPIEQARISLAKSRRLSQEPVSRILGVRAFYGLDFEISPATLDPRPDTETLVDGVLRLIASNRIPGGENSRILDIGTGTGAILAALIFRLPQATGVGTDISDQALEIASRNANRLGLKGRVTFRHTSWLDGIDGPYDIIVSNPPYIQTQELEYLDPEVIDFDPAIALDGGPDGLHAYREIARSVHRIIRPGGWIVTEVGAGQADSVTEILKCGLASTAGDVAVHHEIWRDLGGIGRCVAIEARH